MGESDISDAVVPFLGVTSEDDFSDLTGIFVAVGVVDKSPQTGLSASDEAVIEEQDFGIFWEAEFLGFNDWKVGDGGTGGILRELVGFGDVLDGVNVVAVESGLDGGSESGIVLGRNSTNFFTFEVVLC
jgi:hypothetical protein